MQVSLWERFFFLQKGLVCIVSELGPLLIGPGQDWRDFAFACVLGWGYEHGYSKFD